MAGELVSREKVRDMVDWARLRNPNASIEFVYAKAAEELCISPEAVEQVINQELAETEGGSAD